MFLKPLFARLHVFVGLPLLVVTLFFCAGCDKADDEKITVYRIPKEALQAATNNNDAAPNQMHWSVPPEWEQQPNSGFRKGSFLVRGSDGKTADVSVISFPEAAGGVLANVNRWRDQLKLAPISDQAQAGTLISISGRDMFFVDLVSEQPISPDGVKTRILGGIFPFGGETWFFKMMGPEQLVESQRDAFKKFLQSVHPAGAGSEATLPATARTGRSTNAPTPPPIETPQSLPVQYTLPSNWREKALSPMRLASFNAAAPNGQEVDVSVVALPGMAGGDLANVNRWRDQLKLGPIDEPGLRQAVEHVKGNGHDFLVVDIVSNEPMGERNEKQRIIAAILDESDRSWFIKMVGQDEAVASQKSAFADFLGSLKIPSEMTKP